MTLEIWTEVVSTKNRGTFIELEHNISLQAACREAGRCYLKAPSILDFKHRKMAIWVHLIQMSHFRGVDVLKHVGISKRAQEHILVFNRRQWKKKSNYRGNGRPSVKVRQLSWGSSLGFLADSSGWTCKIGRKGSCTHVKTPSWKTATNSQRRAQLPLAKTNAFSYILFFRTWWSFF